MKNTYEIYILKQIPEKRRLFLLQCVEERLKVLNTNVLGAECFFKRIKIIGIFYGLICSVLLSTLSSTSDSHITHLSTPSSFPTPKPTISRKFARLPEPLFQQAGMRHEALKNISSHSPASSPDSSASLTHSPASSTRSPALPSSSSGSINRSPASSSTRITSTPTPVRTTTMEMTAVKTANLVSKLLQDITDWQKTETSSAEKEVKDHFFDDHSQNEIVLVPLSHEVFPSKMFLVL